MFIELKRNIMLRVLFYFISLLALVWPAKNADHLLYAQSAEHAPPPFRLILGFDGVSYELMTKLYEGGYFRDFKRPLPMIATFPSISDPNWALLTNSPVEVSYTKAHYLMKPQKEGSLGEEVGTVVNHLLAPPQYEKSFNFKPIGVFEHLMTVTWSETSALYWMDSLTKLLLNPENIKGKDYKAFIMNTDIISHVSGEKALMLYLKKVERKLSNLRKNFKTEYNRDLEVVIVSDHGAYYTKPKSINFEKPLQAAGWNWKKTLSEPKDYAFVAPEIISFAAFYTLPKKECFLAIAMSQIDGIHVAMCSPDSTHIQFYSKVGTTELEISPTQKTLSYKVLSGKDPLQQIAYFKKSKKRTWQDYFEDSKSSKYPYALVRSWEGFHRAVQQPASVLLSPEKGYVFTNLTLEILTALSGIHSTHGSLEREESLGVVMSTTKIKEDVFTPSLFSKNYFEK